ncbi:MAG: hypothetical protein ACKO7R_09990 [Pseudanabaena sp.]
MKLADRDLETVNADSKVLSCAEAIALLQEHREAIAQFHVSALFLFGSVSRNGANAKSIAINLSDFALLEKERGNLTLAQQYYDKAKTIYKQLGAIKDLESIEKEWLR